MVATSVSREQVMGWLSEIADPEIPVLSLTDLGIIRDVDVGDEVTVSMTPTYSGCPATEVIEQSVIDTLHDQGIESVVIKRVLSPAWTTDWITEDGRNKLRDYGIAPPAHSAGKRELLYGNRDIPCPRCNSGNTAVISEFGSTACKASYKCNDCMEPFEYFKCI